MISDISGQLPTGFSPASRVWIYQADRLFTEKEKHVVTEMLGQFTRSWRSHGAVVTGFGGIFLDRFIVLIADETEATVSGCSTDTSVQLIRDIEKITGAGLFDRQSLAFIVDDKIELFPLSQLSGAVRDGRLSPETLFFNNAITTLAELGCEWIVPAGKSWLRHRPAFAPVLR